MERRKVYAQFHDADAPASLRRSQIRMTGGLEQKCCDNHPLLRQQRARVRASRSVASAN